MILNHVNEFFSMFMQILCTIFIVKLKIFIVNALLKFKKLCKLHFLN
jgi:hypothetical protein